MCTESVSLSASDLKIRYEMAVNLETQRICCSNVGVVVESGIAGIENTPLHVMVGHRGGRVDLFWGFK